jgi:hypothetical protein
MNFLPERGFFPFSPTPFWQREKKETSRRRVESFEASKKKIERHRGQSKKFENATALTKFEYISNINIVSDPTQLSRSPSINTQ